jgi:hypothetical protein
MQIVYMPSGMIFTTLSNLNRWGLPTSTAAPSGSVGRARRRRAGHKSFSQLNLLMTYKK